MFRSKTKRLGVVKIAIALGLILLGFGFSLAQVPFAFFSKNSDPLRSYPDRTGLVALWRFDESPALSGASLVDYFGNHPATLSTGGGDTADKSVTGVFLGGVAFDGVNDTARVSGNAAFERSSTANLSMMGWIRRTGTWDSDCILSMNFQAFNGTWCPGFLNDSTLLYFDGTSNSLERNIGAIGLNEWNHFALTIENGAKVRFYWNGYLRDITTTADTTALSSHSIDFSADNYGYFKPASLDEVSYWSRTLTSIEVNQVFKNQAALSNTTLVRNFKVFNITSSGFEVELEALGDADNDASAVLHYCNQTDSPGCTPSSPGLSLTKQIGKYTGVVSGLGSPNDAGDFLNLRIVVSDADGTSNSPANAQIRLDPVEPKIIFRSIAAGATTELASGSGANTLAIASGSLTFSSPVPNSIGVGDAIQLSASVGNPTHIVFISGRTSSTAFTVQNADGSVPFTSSISGVENWQIFRAYTSMFNAEAGTENTGINATVRSFDSGNRNLVTNNERWNFAVYGNGTTADTSSVEWRGWTTDRDRYLRIFSPVLSSEVGVSQRHSGVWDNTKYHLRVAFDYNPVIDIDVTHFYLDGIQVDNSHSTASGKCIMATNSNQRIYISNNLCTNSGSAPTDAFSAGFQFGASAGANSHIWVYNNIIFNTKGNCLRNDNPPAGFRLYFYNNLCYGARLNGIYQGAYNSTNISEYKNNIIYATSSGADFFQAASAFKAILENNITSDTSIYQKTITFQNTAGDNYLVDPSETDTLNTGLDLTPLIESDFSFSTDILGNPRPTNSWDIGPNEI